MTEKDILRAMSDIEIEYIEDAAELIARAENGAEGTVGLSAPRFASGNAAENDFRLRDRPGSAGKKRKFNWRLAAGSLAALFAVCVAVQSLSFLGMGSGEKNSSGYSAVSASEDFAYSAGPTDGSKYSESFRSGDVSDMMSLPDDNSFGAGFDAAFAGGKAYQNSKLSVSDVKLVRRASITVQALDFAEAEKELYALVEELGGYFEYSDIYNGGYYSDGSYRSGSYTVRVPSDKYEVFIKSVGENCHVSDMIESVEDIGQQYFDTETRLATLKTKLERLQALLKQAKDLSDIIELESEISETEYEIDSYTSALNRYDSLVGYATVNISLVQVSRVGDEIAQDNSFPAQLARSFKRGLLNVADNIAHVINWAAFNAFGIIVLAAVVILARKYHLVGRLCEGFRKTGKK